MVTGTVKDITKYYELGDSITLELRIGTKLVTLVAKVLDKINVIVPARNGDVAYYYSDILLTKGSDGYLYRVNIIRGTKTSYVIEIKES